MANNERIDDIVSPEALKQIDDLLEKLGSAQDAFANLAKGVMGANAEINKSRSVKEFNKAIVEAGRAQKALEAQEKKVMSAREQANKVERETIEIIKRKTLVTDVEIKSLDKYTNSIDVTIRIQAKLKAELAALRKEQTEAANAFQKGQIDAKTYSDVLGRVAVRESELKDALKIATDTIKKKKQEMEVARKVAMVTKTTTQENTEALKDEAEVMGMVNKHSSEYVRHTEEVGNAEKEVKKATEEKTEAVKESASLLDTVAGSLEENIRLQIRLKMELASVKEEQKKLSKENTQGARVTGTMATKAADLAKTEIELRTAIQQTNLDIRRSVKETTAAEGSYDQLSAKLDRLRATYKALSVDEKNSADVGGVLLSQIKEYDEALKEADASMGVFNRNVGNYTSGTEELTAAAGNLFPELKRVQQTLEESKNALVGGLAVIKNYITGKYAQAAAEKAAEEAAKQASIAEKEAAEGRLSAIQAEYARAKATNLATNATKAGSVALRVFRAALIATGIGAIVVLLGSLVAYLTSTQEGMDKVTAVTRPLQSIFKSLLGVAQDLGKILFDTFSDPKQLIVDFGNLIKDQIINRLTFMAEVIDGILNLDMRQIADGFLQGATGVEGLTGKIEDAAKATGDFFTEAYNRGVEIDRLQKEIEKNEISLIKRQAELANEYKKQSEIAENIAAPEEERRAAAERAIQVTEERLKAEQELIDMRIEKMKLEHSLNDTSRADSKELAELEAERLNFETQASEARTTARSKLNAVNNQIAAQEKKAQEEIAAKNKKDHEERMKQIEDQRQALFSLQDSRLQRASGRNKAVVDDSDLGFEDRMSNLEQYLENEMKLIELQTERELSNKSLLEDDKTRIQEEAQARREELTRQGVLIADKILRDQLTEEEKARDDKAKEEINRIREREAERLTALNESFQRGEVEEKEYQERRLGIIEEAGKEAVLAEIKYVEQIIEAHKAKGLSVGDEERKLAELRQRLSEDTTNKIIDDLKKVEDREKELRDLQKQLSEEVGNLVVALVERRFEKQDEELKRQEAEVENRKEKEIESINASVLNEEEKQLRITNAERKAQIQREEIENKRRKMEIQRAKFDKLKAILGIKVDTARAIVAQLPGLPLTLPLIKMIGIIGAVQLATAIATPIPQFAKGTKYSPEGLAIVGEEGTEMIKEPDGGIRFTGDSAELTYLKKGSQVITNKEVVKMMDNGTGTWDAMVKESRRGTREITKAIKKKPERSVRITKGGISYIYRSGSKMDKYINKLL